MVAIWPKVSTEASTGAAEVRTGISTGVWETETPTTMAWVRAEMLLKE